jgi:hypothetical protein
MQSSFQKIIDIVSNNGVGYKKFFFRSNVSLDEILRKGSEVEIADRLPKDDLRDGSLIIKFSDGDSYLGKLTLSREELRSCVEFTTTRKKSFTLPLVELGDRVLNIKESVEVYLRFETEGDLDGTVGTALVEVTPHRENLKDWYDQSL